jgi:hypothetical protein
MISNRKSLPPRFARKAASVRYSSGSSESEDDGSELARAKLVSAVRERRDPEALGRLLADAAEKSVDVGAIRDCPEKGNTLLHLALSKKCSKGASFAAQEERVKSILELLLLHGCCEAINVPNSKCLANSGGCDSPLTIAADDGLLSVCSLLLENRAVVDFRVENELPDGHQFTPLLYAAKNAARNSGIRDHSALCRLLICQGGDPNARDAKGFSPLMWTVPTAHNPTGQIEFARELLNLGAAVDAIDNEGLTALWWTCHFCEEQHRKSPSDRPPCSAFILLLLARGASADLVPAAEGVTVASPRDMLTRCNLQRVLEREVITISDDDSDDAPTSGASLGKRPAMHRKAAGPCTVPRTDRDLASLQQSASVQRSSSIEADNTMAAVEARVGTPPSAEEREVAAPDSELQLEKKTLLSERNSLRERLKKIDEDLASVKDRIVDLARSELQPIAVKNEQASSESSEDSEACPDRWGRSCAKCGKVGDMLCCEHPGCNLAFHLQCVFLHAIPMGRWICEDHTPKVPVLPRDAGSALRTLLFKPAMTDASTVWSQQRCFAENRIFVLDAADHEFLSEIQARVGAMALTQDIRIVKGMPSGHNAAIQKRIESTLAEAFSNPNSMSSPCRVVVRTIPDSDARVGLRGQSGLFAAQHIPKFCVLEAYRGRLRLRQRAARSCSLMDKYYRGVFEYDITHESWYDGWDSSAWQTELRHDLCIDPLQDAEGSPGFGNEFMLMNDFRDKDPVKAMLTRCCKHLCGVHE